MRSKLFAVPLLIGAGFMIGLSSTETAHAQQKGRAPANRPVPKAANPSPAASRPAPRPSTPTMTRPNPQPQPRPQPQPSRPSIGQRPATPNPAPISRPTPPRPVTPARPTPKAQPNLPAANRPSTLPGLGGGTTRPTPKVNPQPAIRPPANSNNRPSVLPNRPDTPATRPGVNLPNRPTTLPGNLPIGDRPNLPNRPGGVQWPNKPDTPAIRPDRPKIDPKFPIDPKKPIDPKRPINPDRPAISWPNRPNPGGDRPIVNRPGGNNNNNNNTIINRPVTNNTNINNIHNSNNYYSNNTNVNVGNRSGWANSVNGWNNAWYGNYSNWNRSNYPWYHGSWHGNGFNSWGIGPGVGWGLSTWGLNSLAYNFGYSSYVNPFYIAPPATVVVPQYLNYSQPVVNVVQALPESGQEPPPIPQSSAEAFDEARAEFQRGNYANALAKTEAAMKDYPDNPVMHEFRALVLFALGRYQEASSAIYSLLASGPGWDWTTLQSLYADVNTYASQVMALEKAAAAKPDDAALQFLLAYHYTTAGQTAAAKETLTRLRKLMPNDSLIAQLAQAAGVEPEKVAPKDPPPKPPADIQLDITGNWTATRPDGGKIGLAIKTDGGFNWSVDAKGKKDAFDGTFTLEDNVLILERKTGGALMGRVTALAENKFLFKVLGGGDTDPGLTFTK